MSPLLLMAIGERMAETGLWMSDAERDRAYLVRQAAACRLSQREAAEHLGISIRQFKRLVHRARMSGDAGLVSRQRGRPSNNRMAPALRSRITTVLRDKYPDFGPTLAAEKLLDGIAVSAETIRQMQMGLGLWKPKRRRAKRVFQWRERCARFGELIQIDGSPRDWFEGRGPRCELIVFIDDATGRLTALRFGDDGGLSGGAARPRAGPWPAVGGLFRPARHLPGQCQGR
jgi:transposase